MQRYKPLKMKKINFSLLTSQLCSFPFIVTPKVQNKRREEGRGRDFLCGLRDRVGVQDGHLVGGRSLSVGLVLAGRAAHCGSGGGGGGGSAGGDAAAAGGGVGAARGGRDTPLFFGLLAGELGNAEDKLEASQFDVAAVVKQGSALPARPAAADQAGAARPAAAQRLGVTVGLAAHHAACQRQTHHGAGTLVVLALLTATCGEHGGGV